MFKNKLKVKGRKVYGIMSQDGESMLCFDDDLEVVKKSLDSNYPILVEAEVTRLFIRNPDFIEVDIKNGKIVTNTTL